MYLTKDEDAKVKALMVIALAQFAKAREAGTAGDTDQLEGRLADTSQSLLAMLSIVRKANREIGRAVRGGDSKQSTKEHFG